jgi:hypothetical protein
VLLLVSVIAARFRRAGERAFWFGFAGFGWGFFVLGSGRWINPFAARALRPTSSLNPSLITSKLILFLLSLLRMETDDLKAIDQITDNTIGIAHLLIENQVEL